MKRIQVMKRIQDGAGAGYTISADLYFQDVKIDSVEFDRRNATNAMSGFEHSVDVLCLKGKFNVRLDKINAESYYHGTGDIELDDIDAVEIDKIIVEFSSDFLNEDGQDLYYEGDLDNEELVEYIDKEQIGYYLRYTNATLNVNYGGGWSHCTYDGTLESYDVDSTDNILLYVDARIVDENLIDYIDKAVTGDNEYTQYDVLVEGDVMESFKDESDAITYAKDLSRKSENEISVEATYWSIDFDRIEDIVGSDTIWSNF